MTVIGIDPGASGALAEYDPTTGELSVVDMPTWHIMVGRKKRVRIDAVELADYFEMKKIGGAKLALIEAVGGRRGQGAGAGFTFGYGVGLIYMACIMVRLPIETVAPSVWKKVMRVPGKAKEKSREADEAIAYRADELFPDYRDVWRGPKGGFKLDRAEAALLAKYAADYALPSVDITKVQELKVYQNAETGA